MVKITKKGWIEIACCFAAFVAIALIAAFFDLQINKALYNPDSLYGQFFAKLGEMPSYFAAPVVGAILFNQKWNKGKKIDIATMVCGAAIAFVGYIFAIGLWFTKNFISEEMMYKWVYAVFFSAIMTALTIFTFSKIPEKAMRKLFWFAVFLFIVAALSNLIVQIMKLMWSRQRFRTMTPGHPSYPEGLTALYPGYDYDGFTPWYIPTAIFKPDIRTDEYVKLFKDVDHDAFKSFPSGHTCAASVSFALVIIPDLFPKLKKHTWAFWVAPAVYTGLVAISRIVAAAHYLSDTLFGFYSGLCVAALARWILISKFKPYKAETNTEDEATIVVVDEAALNNSDETELSAESEEAPIEA